MNQFFKSVFASCIGVFLALVAISALGFFILMGIASTGGEQQVSVSKGSILHIKLDQPIPEQTNDLQKGTRRYSLQASTWLPKHPKNQTELRSSLIHPDIYSTIDIPTNSDQVIDPAECPVQVIVLRNTISTRPMVYCHFTYGVITSHEKSAHETMQTIKWGQTMNHVFAKHL